jgi:hypothetical protein
MPGVPTGIHLRGCWQFGLSTGRAERHISPVKWRRRNDVGRTLLAVNPADVLGTSGVAAAAFERVAGLLDEIGPYSVRSTQSQVALRGRRGFAYLWRPARYLRGPVAEAVLSIALPAADPSPRWKQVTRVSSRIWMHHLELRDPIVDIDEEVAGWLRAAWEAAA